MKMEHRTLRRTRPIVCWTLAFAVVGPLPVIAQSPKAISPGTREAIAEVAPRCPSFGWSKATGIDSCQLVVYRLPDDGRIDPSDPGTANKTLDVRLPAGARSWTPNLDRCLAAGEYIWFIRGLTTSAPGERAGLVKATRAEWSPGLIFSVRGGPPEAAIADALSSFEIGEQHDAVSMPRWNGSSWGCAEVGLIGSINAGPGLDGGGSSGAVSLTLSEMRG